jgi:hypothetical protein
MNSIAFKNTALGLVLAAGLCAGANAATVVKTFNLDLSGIASNALKDDASNAVRSLLIGAGAQITGMSWDVQLESLGTSTLYDMGIGLSSQTGDFADFGFEFDPIPRGMGSYVGAEDNFSLALGHDFFLGSDGLLSFQFFEFLEDDFINAADGFWRQGGLTITANVVPEPGSYGLAALALLGMGAALRRRAAK